MNETTVPMRDVVRVIEMPGVRGAIHLVHVLSCGCWVIKGKKPRKRISCVSCSLRPEVVGAPRVEDIAWQAFQAGGIHRFGPAAFHEPADVELARAAFQKWWARR